MKVAPFICTTLASTMIVAVGCKKASDAKPESPAVPATAPAAAAIVDAVAAGLHAQRKGRRQ
jgi:hypothetical protein